MISNGEKTVDRLAKQHKVSDHTIKNDAQFARAVDTVAKAAGNGARTALLSRDTKVTKQDALKLGAIAGINVLEQYQDRLSPASKKKRKNQLR